MIPECQIKDDLGTLPIPNVMMKAITQMKNNKQAGNDGSMPNSTDIYHTDLERRGKTLFDMSVCSVGSDAYLP